ncbi:GvpL/GvpF family gas vesicle protein [Actinomycetospora lemnae]|uniref:GvpL/GvpF family gas vesicle protein n=1 Tax=Actinomycetospora lemnae TaxID=3019891 RepID=A0ABT5SU89_9PSEU|nr:GvpL/GvpF family gas vesicle protein [Actinomycetospora sp. DW7H6]MDD7966339.1 GvpL/GvpF family gas vesicle protein [Actinomycetospora sp. DW7H6]
MTTTEDTKGSQETRRGSYIYGIVPAGVRIPDGLDPIPYGDQDGELGLVTEGRLAAVVSDVAADRALGTRRDLMAHEAVLNAIAQDTPVLPMRFGAVVTDDDAVAEELLAPHQDYFVRALEQLEGHLEFRLRGDYDQDAVLGRILEADPRIQQMREKIAGVDEDASYYDRIRLGEAISQAMDKLREEDAQACVDALAKFAVATEVKEVGGENGAVHLAFLVRTDHRSDFERAVDDLGDSWSGRVELRLIGPTAAFDFLPEFDAPDEAQA